MSSTPEKSYPHSTMSISLHPFHQSHCQWVQTIASYANTLLIPPIQ